MTSCLFCRIATKEIAASVRYEDDAVIAFDDIHPKAPTHVLIVPKAHVARLHDLTDDVLAAALLGAARHIARDTGIADSGYRLVVNSGRDGGQEVEHLHLHVIGGATLGSMA